MSNENKQYNFETLGSIAKKLGIGYKLLLSYIEIHPNLKQAIKPYRCVENSLKNKKVLPPILVKEIYQTLGYE